MGPNGTLYVPMRSCWSLCFLVGPYRSLCVLMDSNASVWVLMSCYRSSCVFMDFNESLWLLMCLYASLWVLIGPLRLYRSLRFLIYFYGSLAFLSVLMCPYVSLLACLHVHFWEPVLSSSS